MDGIKITLTLLIDLYGALFKITLEISSESHPCR